MDEFEIWWATYPRKVGKGAARKAYARALKKTTADNLLSSLRRTVEWWQREATEVRFIPHPGTWLNQERWDDVLASTSKSNYLTSEELARRLITGERHDEDEPRYIDHCY